MVGLRLNRFLGGNIKRSRKIFSQKNSDDMQPSVLTLFDHLNHANNPKFVNVSATPVWSL